MILTSTKTEQAQHITISADISILQALKKMDEEQVKLLIVMAGPVFQGLISIGDIQRAIIKNIALDEPIRDILRTDILVAYEQDSFEKIRERMLQYRTECMPVINQYNELVHVYYWSDVFPKEKQVRQKKLDLPVVIMAGGKGTRLAPITNVLPKPLIPVGDKTILEHILDRFVQVKCNRFLMSVNHKWDMIKHYFDTLDNPEYAIEYFREEQFLGTAGSLYLLKGLIRSTFFVSNCDIIIDTDYNEIYNYHREHRNDITIVGVMKNYPIPYGVLGTGTDGKLTHIQEKPELTFKINSGMYLLEPEMLDKIPENKFFHITELIDQVRAEGGKVGVFPVSEGAWMDIGEWSEYNKTVRKLGYRDVLI